MPQFRDLVERGDLSGVADVLAEAVRFSSPVVHKPYEGRPITAAILRGALRVFEDFRYVREIVSADGRDQALVFRARVGDREVHGCDFLHLDDEGLIDDFTVMMRPLSGVRAMAEAMSAQFDQILADAAASGAGESGAPTGDAR